eukprot:4573967-Pleurochrysis_carterae.AAC.1
MARKPPASRPSEPAGRWAPIASSFGTSPTLFGEGRRVSPDYGRSGGHRPRSWFCSGLLAYLAFSQRGFPCPFPSLTVLWRPFPSLRFMPSHSQPSLLFYYLLHKGQII